MTKTVTDVSAVDARWSCNAARSASYECRSKLFSKAVVFKHINVKSDQSVRSQMSSYFTVPPRDLINSNLVYKIHSCRPAAFGSPAGARDR